MELELVTVGSELLLGFTNDTNATEIGRTLAAAGVRVTRKTTVGDDAAAIRAAVSDGLARTGFVITTGGLGPTRDDITKKAIAALLDAPLELDTEYLHKLEARFEEITGRPMPDSNRSQAEVPRGADVLPNPRGTAPGLWLRRDARTVVMLPGVPDEMRYLINQEVVPRIRQRQEEQELTAMVTRSRVLRTTGIAESALASAVAEAEVQLEPASLAFLPSYPGVDLRLTVSGVPASEADTVLERAAAALRPVLGAHYYGDDDLDLAAAVVDRLRTLHRRLAVAESCTGGLLGARITAVPGASDVFAGGVISYEDESKVRDLDVAPEIIESHGAVSEAVVRAMARGVARRFDVAASAAVTGIAGPTGGSPDKPLGTVWLCARIDSVERAIGRRFPGDREAVRHRSAQAALDLLRRLL